MAGTIDMAAQKYAQKASVMPANYARAMGAFIGRDVSGSIPVRAYASKITPATAAKWKANLLNAFGA